MEHGTWNVAQSNLYNPDTDEMRRVGNSWALGFLRLAFCAFVGHVILAAGFAVAGERMTRTLRNMAFKAMVSFIDCSVTTIIAWRARKDAGYNIGDAFYFHAVLRISTVVYLRLALYNASTFLLRVGH